MKASTTAIFAFLAVASLMIASTPVYGEHSDNPVVDIPAGVGACVDPDIECFSPMVITVNPGTTVMWTSDDATAHTITSGEFQGGGDVGSLFDSSIFTSGNVFEYTFEEEGTYPYFCIVHPQLMSGTVIVEAAHDDDHGDREEEMMMGGEEEMMMMGDGMMMMATPDGDVTVHITTMSDLTVNEPLQIELLFTDAADEPIQHINYDYLVTQGNTSIASSATSTHSHDGMGSITTRSLETAEGVDVSVTINGIGLPGTELTGPIGEMVVFNEVPEFGTIAMAILIVAIVSIVAVSARSSVFPRI